MSVTALRHQGDEEGWLFGSMPVICVTDTEAEAYAEGHVICRRAFDPDEGWIKHGVAVMEVNPQLIVSMIASHPPRYYEQFSVTGTLIVNMN